MACYVILTQAFGIGITKGAPLNIGVRRREPNAEGPGGRRGPRRGPGAAPRWGGALGS